MIGAVENAILARIQAAQKAGALGYTIRSLASYAGEFDDDLATVVRQFPAVWVTFKGLGRAEEIGHAWKVPATFTVFVAAQNRRNEKAGRHGAAGEVGSYQMVEDLRALLSGQRLGLVIAALQPGPVAALYNGKTRGALASVYACDFTTGWLDEFAGDVADADLDDFATFHADWDIPPHNDVAGPLPADAPDASDTVILETAE